MFVGVVKGVLASSVLCKSCRARERERVDSSTSVVFLTLSLFLSRRGLCSGERKKKEKLEELGQKKK